MERALEGLSGVGSLERQEPVDGRKRYVLTAEGDSDIRPEIFQLAKKRDWVLWELREDVARMEDVFYSLTSEVEDEVEAS